MSACGPQHGESKGLILVAGHQNTYTLKWFSFVGSKLVGWFFKWRLNHDRLAEDLGPFVPVGRLLQHLVETQPEGLVLKALLDKVLVDPELGRRDELSLWDAREVEAELPPVLLVEIFVAIHCRKERGSNMNRLDIYWVLSCI